MERNRKIGKALEFKSAADILLKDNNIRSAVSLYWTALRDIIFSNLEENNKDYRNTNEAVLKYIKNADTETAKKTMMSYILGIRANWDESLNFRTENDYLHSTVAELKEFVSQSIGEVQTETDLYSMKNILYEDSTKNFNIARRFEYWTILMGILAAFLQKTFLDISYSSMINWLYAMLVLGFFTISVWFKNKSKDQYQSAERLRRFLFLKDIFPSVFDEVEKVWIVDNIKTEYFVKAGKTETYIKNSDNYLESFGTGEKKFIFRLQENTFFTYMLYGRYADSIKQKILRYFIALLFIICIIIVLFHLKLVAYSTLIPEILPLLISLVIVLNQIGIYSTIRKKSEIIKNIDLKVEKLMAINDEKKAWALFDYYNCILWDSYPIITTFFKSNCKSLNNLVKNRMEKYSNEKFTE